MRVRTVVELCMRCKDVILDLLRERVMENIIALKDHYLMCVEVSRG